MTSDGGVKIRNAIDNEVNTIMMLISIEKLIVSTSAAGPFLQRIVGLTEGITYLVYREPVFQVPEGNTLKEIEINNAPNLRSLTVGGTNRYLRRLSVETCTLDRMPPTIPQLVVLTVLGIIRCALTALRMDVFAKSPSLNAVYLTQNQIRQLIPFTSPPKERLTIGYFDLSENQLERLDMSIFVHMPELEWLDVRGNRIVRLEATVPVTHESLKRLLLDKNKISSIDTRNLTLSIMNSFHVVDNLLTEIPTLLGPMPNLRSVSFDRNNIKQVDMSVFRRFTNLSGIYLNENQIESVRTSSSVTLPELGILVLDNNLIVSPNLTGCNFPVMYFISFMNNRLTVIPPLFQRFERARMSVEWNPIKCANMATFKSRFVEGRIFLSTAEKQLDCVTTSMIDLNENVKGCCNA
ncbi:leucine-rich repeat-containing protein let-4-like [Anopheles maculipalpis]|uniref:leucine-rich repeat-containing protein let-4-like n=1 Tax=Anopheles maculipalpis TaxID=1496333 RepID=UPI00215947F2|nr:leucine-rich repeat-containing protein let-4-like [Anopheles maculipalpis]